MPGTSQYDDQGQSISDANVAWYAGKRLLGQGRTISVNGLAPTTQTLTMVATDYLGRAGSASVSINVVRPGLASSAPLANPGVINSNLVLWLSAETGVVVDTNGLVSAWLDQSGQGNNAMQADPSAQPILVSGSNGSPAVLFGANGNQFLSITGQVLTSQQFTIIAVATDLGTTGNSREIFSSSLNYGPPVSFGVAGASPVSPQFGYELGPSTTVQNSVQSPELVSVLSAFVQQLPDGVMQMTYYQNQRVVATAGSYQNPFGQASPYAIGAQADGSDDNFWRGTLSEILVYNTALSSSELQQVYSYLQTKNDTLPVAPQIDSLQLGVNSVTLHFKTQANRAYVVQYTESLADNPIVWQSLTNLYAMDTNTAMTVSDPLGNSERFYRLMIPAVDQNTNPYAPPLLVTQPATQIGYWSSIYDQATFNGTVLPNGSDTTYWFEYGLDTNYGQATSLVTVSASNTAPVAVSFPQTVLAAQATYHYQLVAFNSSGGDQSFTTPPLPPPPIVQTLAASSVTSNSAVLNGNVYGNGSAISGYFQYGLNTNYSSTTTHFFGSGNPAQDFNEPVAGLAASTTYHYRVVAFNATGQAVGDDVTFNTSASFHHPRSQRQMPQPSPAARQL